MIPSYRKGQQGFFDYYSPLAHQAGFDLEILRSSVAPILRFNPKHAELLRHLWLQNGLSWRIPDGYPNALLWPVEAPFGTLLPGYAEHLFYPMNASSLFPVLALEVQPNDVVLDACAAPGGKTLMIAEQLSTRGRLVANDSSSARCHRLRQTLRGYGFPGVEVWNRKAETIFKSYFEVFDKILLDAPCSSEKHVLLNPAHLARWSHGRVRQLQHKQIALLCGLFLALKPGGRLVYSTCALTPEENEGVVDLFLKKKGGEVRLLPWRWPELPGGTGCTSSPSLRSGTPPSLGEDDRVRNFFDLTSVRRVWPDGKLLDPMFVAVFEKIACRNWLVPCRL